MALVFQYGSNTSVARLNSPKRLCGDAKSLGLAVSCGCYDVGFTVWSKGNGCAAADLVRSRTRHAWGVLYDIPDRLLDRDTAGTRKALDAIEGPRYRRRRIRVYKPSSPGDILTVWTYTVIDKKQGMETSCEYVKHILTGLREHSAPAEYIEHVRTRALRNNPSLAGSL